MYRRARASVHRLDTMKWSVHEVKLTGLWARNCATIQQVLISNFTFGPEKLPGLPCLLPEVVLFDRSVQTDGNWPFHFQEFSFPVPLRWENSNFWSKRNALISGHPGGSTPGTYCNLWIEGTCRPRGGVMVAFRGEILFFGGWVEFVNVVVQLADH